MNLIRIGAALAALAAAHLSRAQTQLVFEAENVAGPQSAWKVNDGGTNHWNLWSTDKDAKKKWSGGAVLKTPVTKADRSTPEEGAPPLLFELRDIPPGRYAVQLKTVRTLALSRDGKNWEPFRGGALSKKEDIRDGSIRFWLDDRFADSGSPGSAYIDTITLTPWPEIKPKPPVEGHAKSRVTEKLDRGLVALPCQGGVHLSWRLLRNDPPGVAFHAYMSDGEGPPSRLTSDPVRLTTDFTHKGAALGAGTRYFLRAVAGDAEGDPSADAVCGEAAKGAAFVRVRLDGTNTFQKAAVTDLDGDGRYDLVIKSPNSNIDPWHKYWRRSTGTYVVEARKMDGTVLWRNDLGWGIEQGIWYSPYIAADFDGDGRAEVAAKIGEGDPRDKDGRVTAGPEWLVVWDGLTGKERARVPWIDRSAFGEGASAYNYASRNQLAVACLDGRTPCIVVLRGTYTAMRADAYDFDGKVLRPLWKYSDEEAGPDYRGQGAHFTHAADVDGDGREEVILGSAVIDDNGLPLWSTWLGHPDHFYVGDIDPAHPGLEIYYGIETRQPKNGMCLVDAATGQILWGWDKPTKHIHGHGLCSDIDPAHPGCEAYGADSADHKATGDRWLWNAKGKILSRDIDLGFGARAAYWDADPQRELILKNRVCDFGGAAHPGEIEGSWVLTADIFGDWREEIITSVAGEIRIYSTTIPARDRRISLMQDPIYRADVTMCTMGYPQVPMTSYDLANTPAGQ